MALQVTSAVIAVPSPVTSVAATSATVNLTAMTTTRRSRRPVLHRAGLYRAALGASSVAAVLVFAACSGDDEASPPDDITDEVTDTSTAETADTTGTDEASDGRPTGRAEPAAEAVRDVSQPALGRVSDDYVAQLCAIDPFAAADTDDPIGTLIDQLASITTFAAEDQAEIETLVGGFEAARAGDIGEPLSDAVGILRARCSGLVVR